MLLVDLYDFSRNHFWSKKFFKVKTFLQSKLRCREMHFHSRCISPFFLKGRFTTWCQTSSRVLYVTAVNDVYIFRSYTRATILELLRFTTIGSLGLPHETTCDTTVQNQHVPKGTYVTTHEIGRAHV